MKRLLIYFLGIMLISPALKAQDLSQKVSGLIFADVVHNIGAYTPELNAFEMRRAYLGYEKEIHPGLTAVIKLDIGSPDDVSAFALKRRFAYFKNAGVTYKNGNFEGAFGIITMYSYKVQEKFWGRRYMMQSFMDVYRFGPSADLGVLAKYRVNDWFSGELTISNGEGYSNIQVDQNFKYALGIQFDFLDGFVGRLYADIIHHSDKNQITYSSFLGYKADKFDVAAEANYQHYYRFGAGDKYGYSVYGTYWINDKFDLFVRYDQLYSTLNDEDTPWDLDNDGSAIKSGVEYLIIKPLRASLNYEDWMPYASNGTINSYVFLNVEVKF